MENDKLKVTENGNNSDDSLCCGFKTPCCKEEDSSSFSSKIDEVKVAEPVLEKASGGCGCGCNC